MVVCREVKRKPQTQARSSLRLGEEDGRAKDVGGRSSQVQGSAVLDELKEPNGLFCFKGNGV